MLPDPSSLFIKEGDPNRTVWRVSSMDNSGHSPLYDA